MPVRLVFLIYLMFPVPLRPSFDFIGTLACVTMSSGPGYDRSLSISPQVRSFFAGKDLRSANRALQQALESIQLNIRWRRRHEGTVAGWLESWHQQRGPTSTPEAA